MSSSAKTILKDVRSAEQEMDSIIMDSENKKKEIVESAERRKKEILKKAEEEMANLRMEEVKKAEEEIQNELLKINKNTDAAIKAMEDKTTANLINIKKKIIELLGEEMKNA